MKRAKKINGYLLTTKSCETGWMAKNYGEAVLMASFLEKRRNEEVKIEEHVFEF